MTTFVLATSNPGKVREFGSLLGPLGVHVLTPSELGRRLQVEETGGTFEANAVLKAEAGAVLSTLPCIADDSGLEVDALDGRPGVHSARYGGPGLDDEQRTQLLLQEMRGQSDRCARFVSVIALARSGHPTMVFRGEVRGQLTEEVRGTGGFGYDPIFLYRSSGKTFAEMSAGEKDAVSHRARAAQKLIMFLTESPEFALTATGRE